MRSRRIAAGVAVAVAAYLLALTGLLAVSAPTAFAGQWVQASCVNPSGSSAASQGWRSFTTGSPGYGSNAGTSCNASNPMYAILSSDAAAPVGSGEDLQYTPPAGSTLAGGEVQVDMQADGYGQNASGTAVAYTPSFEYNGANVFFQCAAGLSPCANGTNDFSGVLGIPGNRGGDFYIGAGCGGDAGEACNTGGSGGAWALVYLYRADMLLSNNATPAASGVGGTLLEGVARGSRELAFTATDPGGPGVYTVSVTVDGQSLYDATPDSNGGRCVSQGAWNGTATFDYAQPCRSSESVDIPVQTAGLKDGQHTIKITLTDAAGNTAVVYDSTISTDNAPEETSAPTVITPGQVTVGTALSSQPGEWSAPQDAGSVSYTYQWQDCNSEGEACKAIPGATSASYTPAPSDVAHTLRLLVTAADSDGSSSASSTPTQAVLSQNGTLGAQPGPGAGPTSTASSSTAGVPAKGSATSPAATSSNTAAGSMRVRAVLRLGVKARITRSFARRALHRLTGRLLNGQGHPIVHAKLLILQRTGPHGSLRKIGHVKTAAKGAFRAHVPPGPSRVVEVAYRARPHEAGYAAIARVRETVRAGVRLHISPRSTTPSGTILLTGRVLGRVPGKGVVVELLVHYRGRWEPFRDPRSDGEGRFQAAYQFQGAQGRFPFRAEVISGQSRFPFATGNSKVIDVHSH